MPGDLRYRHRGPADDSAMATVALLGQFLRRYGPILGGFGFLNGVERNYIFDVAVARTGQLRITSYNVCYTKLLRVLTALL